VPSKRGARLEAKAAWDAKVEAHRHLSYPVSMHPTTSCLASDWCGLDWSPWVTFGPDASDFRLLSTAAGVYRIRPLGGGKLAYIGQTGRNLRERMRALRADVLSPEMPFNDPHTAAPSLWALRHSEGMEFACSVASTTLADHDREALECWLLWKYRLEKGESTRCNHG
jgi:hypothetical protein